MVAALERVAIVREVCEITIAERAGLRAGRLEAGARGGVERDHRLDNTRDLAARGLDLGSADLARHGVVEDMLDPHRVGIEPLDIDRRAIGVGRRPDHVENLLARDAERDRHAQSGDHRDAGRQHETAAQRHQAGRDSLDRESDRAEREDRGNRNADRGGRLLENFELAIVDPHEMAALAERRRDPVFQIRQMVEELHPAVRLIGLDPQMGAQAREIVRDLARGRFAGQRRGLAEQ